MHPWKVSNVSLSITSCVSAWISSVVPNDALSALISSWGIGKIRRERGQANRGGGNHCNVLEVRNCKKRVMCERALCHGAEPSCFSSNWLDVCEDALRQPLHKLSVKLDGLTWWYEFLVNNTLDVEKNDQHELDIATNMTRFFRTR